MRKQRREVPGRSSSAKTTTPYQASGKPQQSSLITSILSNCHQDSKGAPVFLYSLSLLPKAYLNPLKRRQNSKHPHVRSACAARFLLLLYAAHEKIVPHQEVLVGTLFTHGPPKHNLLLGGFMVWKFRVLIASRA